MNKEEILIAIREIQCRYSLPALEKNFTDKDYACKQYEKLVIHLANQQEEKDKEIERLNREKSILEKSLKLTWRKDIEIDYDDLDVANKFIEKVRQKVEGEENDEETGDI